MKKKNAALPVIGWREWVSLPSIGVERIKAKIDTGARTSALHAVNLSHFEKEDGSQWVRFHVQPVPKSSELSVVVEERVVDMRRVKSSNGRSEQRPVIEITLSLLGRKWPIEVTLTRRDEMGFQLLLGRQAIRRKALVNPGGSFLASTKKL